jgi:hypothetical protein
MLHLHSDLVMELVDIFLVAEEEDLLLVLLLLVV